MSRGSRAYLRQSAPLLAVREAQRQQGLQERRQGRGGSGGGMSEPRDAESSVMMPSNTRFNRSLTFSRDFSTIGLSSGSIAMASWGCTR